MSTRSTIHFHWYSKEETIAIVYRHSDGYPDGMLPDLKQFFEDVQAQTTDTRFNDPSYLAAKYVVWQADQHAYHYDYTDKGPEKKKAKMLAFLGVGVVVLDPGDIAYRYHVWCGILDEQDHPKVTWEEA